MTNTQAQFKSELSSQFCDVSQGRMHYHEAGNGETIVFLHGIPGSSNSWIKVAEELSRDFHVIVPDLMGFGRSSKPQSDYYMTGQSKCLYELLVKKDVQDIYLVGHDFGGPVSVTFSKQHPDIRVKKMALMATNLFIDTPIPGPMKIAKVPLLGQLFFKMMAGTTFGFKQMYKQGAYYKQEFTLAEFSKHISSNNKYFTYKIFYKSLADLKKNYAEVQKRLGEIEIPVLIVWGDKDPFFPVSVGDRSAMAIKYSTMITYKDTGHFIPEERPAKLVNDLRRFILNRDLIRGR
ncbi:MAG: alpha/beta hydrolase [Cyclobacteriaceae bacterium]|nr:alpha/beta hydrolase [Cyclobacteriaceae bacterium]